MVNGWGRFPPPEKMEDDPAPQTHVHAESRI